ncbi:MAG: hypothetical protein KDE27_24850 [Planctomycetes bacterium]|nr:hypothetical protein [Planctomycetota bacterium]
MSGIFLAAVLDIAADSRAARARRRGRRGPLPGRLEQRTIRPSPVFSVLQTRRVVVLAVMLPALAAQVPTAPSARIDRLAADDRARRDAATVVPFLQQAAAGPRVEIEHDGVRLATLMIGPDGWGRSPVANVAAVAASVATTLYSAMPPPEPLTIALMRVPDGPPKALSARGPKGEYVVQVNTGDLLWAQLSYQLAHELGHVGCGRPDPSAPQQWLEEAFCEACSIWAMEHMAVTWETSPPYPNWAPYAEHLRSYAEDVRATVVRPESYARWYAEHRARLDAAAGDRALDRVVAEQLFERFEARPESIRAFSFLRVADPVENTIEARLRLWREQCPDELEFMPRELATLLGVSDGGAPR